MTNKDQYKYTKELLNRIVAGHRMYCKGWKEQSPCFNCHLGLIGKVEKETFKK